jgi:hypothetical protein
VKKVLSVSYCYGHLLRWSIFSDRLLSFVLVPSASLLSCCLLFTIQGGGIASRYDTKA